MNAATHHASALPHRFERKRHQRADGSENDRRVQRVGVTRARPQRLVGDDDVHREARGPQRLGNGRSDVEGGLQAGEIAHAGRAGPHQVEVDLMQPIDPEKAPRVHSPPLNHVGLWVDDLPAAVEWLAEQGMRFAPGGIRTGASGHDICFVHPKGNEEFPIGGEGVLIELVQAPPEVIEELE